jgi:membrane protein implicated in regulation of membrane protease activity
MHVAFAVTFGIFLVLMAVLVVFVGRFAVREGRRRKPQAVTESTADPSSRGRPGTADEATANGPHPHGDGELDEASSTALVDDPDEGGDG